MKKFPPRLHVLLARDTDAGVVLRRGPSKSVCSIRWDRRNDTFTLGQWLRGRIYERRSDLSPDGRYLIYFAMNGKWDSETKGSWTAISIAPYLKAVTLLGKGDCWNGGGLFTSARRYWLNDGYGHFAMVNSSLVERDVKSAPAHRYGGECPGVYYHRLQRDGWTLNTEVSEQSAMVFEKQLRHGWVLRKYAHAGFVRPAGKGCYWDEHELEQSKTGRRIDGAKWEWAEADGTDIVWTEHGCLFRAALTATGLGDSKLLNDFSDMKFEALPAPY